MSSSEKWTSVLQSSYCPGLQRLGICFPLSRLLSMDIILLLIIAVLPILLPSCLPPCPWTPLYKVYLLWGTSSVDPPMHHHGGVCVAYGIAFRCHVLITRPSAPKRVCLPTTGPTPSAGPIPGLCLPSQHSATLCSLGKITKQVRLGVGVCSAEDTQISALGTIAVFLHRLPYFPASPREEYYYLHCAVKVKIEQKGSKSSDPGCW